MQDRRRQSRQGRAGQDTEGRPGRQAGPEDQGRTGPGREAGWAGQAGKGRQCRHEGQAGRAVLELQANREGKGNQARQTGFGRAGLHVRPARQGKHLDQSSIATQRMQSRQTWPTGQGRVGQGTAG